MTEYYILPVNGAPKSGAVRKFSPGEEERGRERHSSGKRENNEGFQKEKERCFPDLFSSRVNAVNKSENAATPFAYLNMQTPPIVYSYQRAKVLASTLAFALTQMHMSE